MSAQPQPKETRAEDRLSIRANAFQKQTLRRAAEARHLNVSQFVLQASLEEAERVIAAESTIAYSAEQYEWMIELLDAEPGNLENLSKALRQKPVWDA